MEDNYKIKIGITQGDINGIGYEVILKTFADPTILELCTPIIYGSTKIASYHRKTLNINANFTMVNSAEEVSHNRINIVNCNDEEIKVEFSQPTEESGRASYEALEKACEEYKKGLIDALVTAPINKHTIQNEDFHFPGHTEYLEQKLGNGKKALMILINRNLRVALVTTHLPIRDVANAITKENIIEKVHIFNDSLKKDFGLSRPRIAVLALNPHAGDNGLIGSEEQEIIIPTIEELSKEDILAFGPYPADGFFGSEEYTHFDGILAMYHDQGLAPFKALAMEEGVNYTAGLPIIRTSPAHGTAYDIAGKGIASEESFRQAIYSAIDIYRARHQEEKITRNPLRKLYFDKKDDSDKLKLDSIENEDI